jgi:hypothetical protein
MIDANRAAQARALLETAYKELLAAAKVVVGDDGPTLLSAAAAVDVAVECLVPPQVELALATSSCRDAIAQARATRSYAQGGSIANLLDPARRKLDEALALLEKK